MQEAWLGVLNGIDRFEGRSSLKTWIMRIVVNIAMTRGEREARSIPFSAFATESDEPAVDPDRFRDESDGFPGHWRAYPRQLGRAARRRAPRPRDPERRDERDRGAARGAARRDHACETSQGCSSEEVCGTLDVSEGNQRVLLHRARSHVRSALERHLDG